MRSLYKRRDYIKKLVERLETFRSTTAVVHSVDDYTVNLTIGGFPSVVQNVRVIGDINMISPGDQVDILWDKDRPVVLLGGVGKGIPSGGGAIRVDGKTLEGSWEGYRVKREGIGVSHLNFTPVIEGSSGSDPLGLGDAGWRVDNEGVLYNENTRLHPDGLISLGQGSEIVKLSGSEGDHRIWVGAASGEYAPFAVNKDGSFRSTLGEIGGWTIDPGMIHADNQRAQINSKIPYISLGDVSYTSGEGFWVGKHGSVYRLKLGNDVDFLRWDGRSLVLSSEIRIGAESYEEGVGFWVGDDQGTYKLRIGDEDNFLNWDGDKLSLSGELGVGADGYQSGVGFWVGEDQGTPKLFIGDPEGDHISWDGDTLHIDGDISIPTVTWEAIEDIPAPLEPPSGSGLFLTGTHMGYYNNGVWTAVLTNNGWLELNNPMSDDQLVWDGNNLLIQGELKSTNFIPGVQGWGIGREGSAEFNNVTVRGALQSSVIEHEQVAALNGGLIASRGAAVVESGFVIGLANTQVSLHVPAGVAPEDVSSYFADGDIVRVKSGAVNLWAEIVSSSYDEDAWQVTLSKLEPEGDVSIQAGMTLFNYGSSGDGAIEIAGYEPSIRMFTHDGSPHEATTNFMLIGDLDGHFGIGETKLGFGVGDPNMLDDYLVATEDGLRMSGEIRVGAHSYAVGNGFYVGKVDGIPHLRIGNPDGDHILWDGNELKVKGNIAIVEGSGGQNLSGLGSLASQDTVDYSQVTGNKPHPDATIGATWGENLFGVPESLYRVGPPDGSGLYLDAERMGYHDGGEWITYIDDTGAFHFKGEGGAFIEWNSEENKLFGFGDDRVQWYASSEDGRLYAGDGSVILDEIGIRVKGDRAAFFFVDFEQPEEPVGTVRMSHDIQEKRVIRIINGLDASEENIVFNGAFSNNTNDWILETQGGNTPQRTTSEGYVSGTSIEFEPFILDWVPLETESGQAIQTEQGQDLMVLSPGEEDIYDRLYTDGYIEVEPGMQYLFSAQVKRPEKPYQHLSVKIRLYNASTILVRERTVSLSDVGFGSWDQVRDIFETQSNEEWAQIEFRVDYGVGGDDENPESLFVDDVGLFAISAHDSQIELGEGYINLGADVVNLPQSNPTSDWQAAPKKYVDDAVEAGATSPLEAYPVGAIYMSVSSTSPASLFGGTWEAFGQGRVLVGVDTSDNEFNTVEKEGGAKTHTLTWGQMPSHSHTIHNDGVHHHEIHRWWQQTGLDGPWRAPYSGWGFRASTGTSGAIGAYARSAGSHSHGMDNAGGGNPHNNLQPYITVYMWKRIA